MEYVVLNKRRNIFYLVVFFTGLILTIWEISIFRKTVVPINLLLLLVIGIGSLATFFDCKNYKNTYDLEGWKLYFFAFMQNTLSWGLIVCSILILSNYYFSTSEITERSCKIIERSSMPGSKGNRNKRKPLVLIDYEGEMKELVFSHRHYEELNDYKYVNINTKKGFVLWDIIVHQELKK